MASRIDDGTDMRHLTVMENAYNLRGKSAVAAGWTLGLLSSFLQPLELAGTANALHLSGSAAASLLAADVGGAVAVLLFFGVYSPKISYRDCGGLGVILLLCACLSSFIAPSYWLLLCARCVAGLGAGIVLGTTNAFASGFPDPTKTAAQMNGVSVVVASSLFFIGPSMLPHNFGLSIFVLLLIAGIILGGLFLAGLPVSRMNIVKGGDAQFSGGLGSLFLFLASATAFCMTNAGLTSFAIQLGQRAGLSIDAVSGILGLGLLCGLIGPIMLQFISTRWARTWPILIALSADLIASLILGGAVTPIGFFCGVLLLNTAGYVLIPYFFGYAAEMDVSGRMASLLGSVSLGSFAIGPLSAGYIVDRVGLSGIGYTGGGALCLAILTYGMLALRTGRKTF